MIIRCHDLWDQFPGRSDTYRAARNKVIADLANPDLVSLGAKAATQLDEKAWLDESRSVFAEQPAENATQMSASTAERAHPCPARGIAGRL